MTDLSEIFAELGISHYLREFIEQGFDTWDTILDITESDFDALGVKLGHRRKLQRKIANSRGLSSDRALASPTSLTPADSHGDEPKVGGRDAKEGGSGPHGAKRKYRRHPKSDENAPERPPSAYVIFSNEMREKLKGRNLSFTEIAKLVGENWQNLSPNEKEPYEHQAYTQKERYNNELAEYKKTQSFKDYSQYLANFKQKQNQQLANEMDFAKRPKLEALPSAASSGTASSGGSQTGAEFSLGRMRVDSSASSMSPWHASSSPSSTVITPMSTLPSLTNASQMPILQNRLGPGSPVDMPVPTVLPGYRESKLAHGGSPTMMSKALPSRRESAFAPGAHHWREDHHRGDNNLPHPISRTTSDESPVSQSTTATTTTQDHFNIHDSKRQRRTPQMNSNPPPPSLTSESTVQSSGSAASNLSIYSGPRTPLEPDLNRNLPFPQLYPQKSGSYDSQLPFLSGPPSLSPQNTLPGPQQSSHVNAIKDFPTTMPPIRRFSEVPQAQSISNPMGSLSTVSRPEHRSSDPRPQSVHNYISTGEEDLDPIDALLRAGAIVNRNSAERQP